MPLSSEKRERLSSRIFNEIPKWEFPPPEQLENEESFTARVVGPTIKTWVASLREPELYVRSDGGPDTLPLYWSGISLYPDITVSSHSEKYIAFEVKFLRSEDPGGSMTKCIGQTYFYHFLDFDSSFGLVFDLRTASNAGESLKFKELIEITENTQVLIFR